ncbi:hypothetical protein KC950_02965 [Candidatus Saccharibacteria bacterium]|mgnify:CR=1 FL=1|nr:hypothetical protein [Candidatus Saccharibacteria bacterium]
MSYEIDVLYRGLDRVNGFVGPDDIEILGAEVDDIWYSLRREGQAVDNAIVDVAEVASIRGIALATRVLRGVLEDFDIPPNGQAVVSTYASNGAGAFSQPYMHTLIVGLNDKIRLDVDLHAKKPVEAKQYRSMEVTINPGDVILASGRLFQRGRNISDEPQRNITFLY